MPMNQTYPIKAEFCRYLNMECEQEKSKETCDYWDRQSRCILDTKDKEKKNAND